MTTIRLALKEVVYVGDGGRHGVSHFFFFVSWIFFVDVPSDCISPEERWGALPQRLNTARAHATRTYPHPDLVTCANQGEKWETKYFTKYVQLFFCLFSKSIGLTFCLFVWSALNLVAIKFSRIPNLQEWRWIFLVGPCTIRKQEKGATRLLAHNRCGSRSVLYCFDQRPLPLTLKLPQALFCRRTRFLCDTES